MTYVVLHLNDGRRLYGWPREWPSIPTEGHFLIFQPAWLIEIDKNKLEPQLIEGVETILINVNDVKWVEFLEKTWEKTMAKQSNPLPPISPADAKRRLSSDDNFTRGTNPPPPNYIRPNPPSSPPPPPKNEN